jgi:predicted membrane-bound spermidine synthase
MARPSRRVAAALCALFFASGASALILENLWFREAGVFLGNSVQATSLVLAAFVGGLALGGWLAARRGHRVARLVRLYGVLEIVAAVTGVAVVLVLPALGAACAPAFRALAGSAASLAIVRALVAFVLMLAPTTAMGATLPVLVAALDAREPGFGRALGRLYGWNTLGAVAGSVAVELALSPWLGIRGTACAVLALGGAAGACAIWLSRSLGARGATPAGEVAASSAWPARRALATAFLCGAAFLALEVIWFRFLALYVLSTSLALALVLAVLLGGIGLGGLAASWALQRAADRAERALPWLAALAGVAAVGSYRAFPVGGFPGSSAWQDAVTCALRLALPTSLVSGALFTILGSVVQRQLGRATHAAGALVTWNTLGAMVGALAGGYVLLPALGVDGALFVACALYVAAAACAPRAEASSRRETLAACAVAAACLALFPFGRMREHVEAALGNVTSDDAAIIAYREALTGTLTVVEHRWEGHAVSTQLVTDGYSMSSTAYTSRRYMQAFVYLPVALRPEPKRALLVCFGVGQTAQALVDTASLEHIDVVDTSRAILDLGRVDFPPPAAFPLDDPRVAVHVEDGRFFLQTTRERYDLITGEPPPPHVAGVVNLYSQEYFDLVRAHLTDGGVATYWLPAHQLSVAGAQAITRAFCDVFADCSLWTGFGDDWILLGTRGLQRRPPPSEEAFARQWRDPRVAPELAAVAIERPEQLGAMFMADAPTLAEWTRGAAPLDDDHPARLGGDVRAAGDGDGDRRAATFARWMDPAAARARFEASDLIGHLWPPALRARTGPYFAVQALIDALPDTDRLPQTSPAALARELAELRAVQTDTDLRTLVLWTFGYTAANERILDAAGSGAGDPELETARGVRDLADHRFAEAAARFGAIRPETENLRALHAYALALAKTR